MDFFHIRRLMDKFGFSPAAFSSRSTHVHLSHLSRCISARSFAVRCIRENVAASPITLRGWRQHGQLSLLEQNSPEFLIGSTTMPLHVELSRTLVLHPNASMPEAGGLARSTQGGRVGEYEGLDSCDSGSGLNRSSDGNFRRCAREAPFWTRVDEDERGRAMRPY